MTSKFEAILEQNKFVILDTETTGLARPAAIVSIGIIDPDGNTLLDTLVNPLQPIPAGASRVHGIFDKDVQDAPKWETVREQVLGIIAGKHVITYNAEYDRMLCALSDEAAGLPPVDYEANGWFCAMEWYAEVYGDWNNYHNSYTWQRLTKAMKQQDLPVLNAHRALGDCLMTLSLIRKLTAPKSKPLPNDLLIAEIPLGG